MPRFEEIPRVHIIEREEMPMNKTKKTLRKILAVVLSLSMMLSMTAISPKKADAFMKADVTEIKSSDMSELLSHYWNYKLEDNKLTINITDTEAEKNVQAAIAGGATKAYYQAGLDLYIDNVATGTSTAQPLTSGNFDGNTCTISQDVSSIAQTINTLVVSVSLVTTTKVGLKTTKKATLCYNFPIYLEKENGKISIYSPYGAAAVKALEDFNANYKPENYLKTRTFTNIACKSFEKIVEKAKELTKDCKNDGEKIKIIHDWICTNVAYNYPAIQGTTSGNTTDIDTSYKYGEKYGIDRAFEDGLAVCSGYASLGELMFRAAGIPSMCIEGTGGALDDGTENKSKFDCNHEWNVVYYNNSWHFMDLTWDSPNVYYGKGDSRNISGKAPYYTYFGIQAELFGVSHYQRQIFDDAEEVTGIKVVNPRTQYFVGQNLEKNSEIELTVENNKKTWYGVKENAAYSGYDLSKPGKQTVTVRYMGLETTYDIEVLEMDHIKVVPSENTTYLIGSKLKTDFKLYVVAKDGTEVLIKDTNAENTYVTCSGYDMNKEGKQTVTVSYKDLTAQYDINVVDAKEISVETDETPVYPYGTQFKPNFKLYVTKSDGTKQLVENGTSLATCTGYDLSNLNKVGEQEVTVTYLGLTAKYKIKVVLAVGLGCVAANKSFEQGQELDTTRNKVYYVLKNGEELMVNNADVTYSGYDKDKTGIQKITVTCNGLTTSYYVTVKAKSEPTATPTVKPTKQPTATPKATATVKPTRTPSVTASANPTTAPDDDAAATKKPTKTSSKNPKGTKIAKVKAGSKKLVVKVKTQKVKTNGYQIRYSLKKNMKGSKTITLTRNTRTSATIKKLKGRKTYYIQVRTYRKIGKKKYYSTWSKAVAKKTLR